QESYSYDYGTNPHAAAPKPLTILDHLGGSPLIAVVGPVGDPTPAYKWLVQWLHTFYGHVDAVAKELAPENAYQQAQQGLAMARPYLKKFDEITGSVFLPALGDGEAALVFDAKWT